MENGSQMTLDQWMPETSLQQTVGASDSLAKTSALQENNLDLLETAQVSFSELCTWLDNSKKKKDPLSCSLRTLKICLVLMEDGISPGFSLKWIGGGYDAEWQVLNSKHFGVPQNRERCFIIGHLRDRSTAEIFPVEGTDGEDRVHGVRQVGQLYGTEAEGNPSGGRVYDSKGQMRTLGNGNGMSKPMCSVIVKVVGNTNPSGKGMNGNCYSSDGVNPTLTTNKGEGNKVAIPIGMIDDQGRLTKKVSPKDCVGTLRSESHGNEQKVVIPVLTPDRANKSQNGRRFKEDGEEAFTLTSQDRHGVAVEVNPEVIGGSNDVFAIDKGIRPEEREVANCIESREDRGLSKRNQEGTLICHKIT